MSKKVKKNPMAATLTGDVDDLEEKEKLSFLKKEYALAIKTMPDYAAMKKELNTYQVELPKTPDYIDLSAINELYAIAQSYSSRVTTMEVAAIDATSRWERLVNLMDGYLEDKMNDLLSSEEFEDMTKLKAESTAKTRLKKHRKTLRKLKDKLVEAKSFKLMVEIKKKDLVSVLTTLGKQVKALSLEQSTHR